MLNKKISVFFLLFLCGFICWADILNPQLKENKESKYQLILYFNPITEYSERSIEQIRKGAYKDSKICNLTYRQVKKIMKNVRKEKLNIIYDLWVQEDISYIDFMTNKNAHSFGEIIDSRGNTIFYFTFDEYHSQYMVINDFLVEKSLSLYELIENDIITFVENSISRREDIKTIDKSQDWDL